MDRNIDKNDKLSNLIKKLSTQNISDSYSTDEFFKEFKEIYSDNFRHLYSMLFSIIVENSEEENGSLAENMRIIYNKLKDCDNETDEYLKKSIFKLYDHINLDISRVNYFLSTYKKNETDKKNLTEKLQKEAEKLQKIKRQTQSMQKEYIAILGIFSAIVITFVAGLVFTSSILQNIEKASVYRLLLITWLLGFILMEVLYSLFLFIEIITNKTQTSNNNTTKNNSKNLVRLIFLTGVLIIFAAWFFDIVNFRKKIIYNLYSSNITTEKEIKIQTEKQNNN